MSATRITAAFAAGAALGMALGRHRRRRRDRKEGDVRFGQAMAELVSHLWPGREQEHAAEHAQFSERGLHPEASLEWDWGSRPIIDLANREIAVDLVLDRERVRARIPLQHVWGFGNALFNQLLREDLNEHGAARPFSREAEA